MARAPGKPRTSKPTRIEEQLAAVRAVREDPHAPGASDVLKRALESPSGFVVASAAGLVRDRTLTELAPLLPATFERLCENGAEHDKGCVGKLAIVEAMTACDQDDPRVLLRGIRYVQREPAYGAPGGYADTAGSLRGACAIGLARGYHPDTLDELAMLLADPEAAARANAARALGGTGNEGAAALLRFKALLGDEAPEVMTECFGSLLLLSPRSGLGFVAGFLERKDEAVAEAAALALGQSRRAEAFEILREWSERQPGPLRRAALVAIGLLRSAESTDCLVALIGEGSAAVAAWAIAGLAVQRFDAGVRARVEEAVAARAVPSVREAFIKAFHE